MKRFKKMMAIAIVAVMTMMYVVPSMAFAEQTQPDGSITVKSPVVGASYTAYQVFEMTTNATNDSFSYTIDTESPFYNAVKAYADATGSKLKLTKIAAEHRDAVAGDPGTPAYDKFNVSVEEGFDAQDFGKAMRTALKGEPAKEATDTEPAVDAKPASISDADARTVSYDPNYGKDSKGNDLSVVSPESTLKTTDQIIFGKQSDGTSAGGTVGTALPLGYYLILATYPPAEYGTVTMTPKNYDGSAKEDAVATTFGKDDVDDEGKLTDAAKTKISDYVDDVVDNDYVDAYIAAKDLKHDDGTALTDAEKYTDTNSIKAQLKKDMKEDAEAKVQAALDNQLAGSESDINVKEPILVFVDSTTPNAVINEKNEIDKWDIPVNPSGDALPKDLPDYGEPDGGKNIVIKEAVPDDPKTEANEAQPAIYADWTEANIGDSVHYQLRINAMNFVKEGDTADTVKQVKEYFLADYQNAHMTFDADKKLKVSVIDGSGKVITKNSDGTTAGEGYLDYTSKADTFFKNDNGAEVTEKPTDVFVKDAAEGDTVGTGIMVPWVKVSEANPAEPDPSYPIYTTNVVVRTDSNGEIVYKKAADGDTTSKMDENRYLLDEDNHKIPETDTYYVYSLYSSDVTIVVDYYMTLEDDAVIDGNGNPNYAQYAYSTVEPKDTKPNNPKDEDKPSKKQEVDDATIYTFALAFVKVNKKAEALANATFELPFYVQAEEVQAADGTKSTVAKKANDGSYVYAWSNDEYDELEDSAKTTKYTNSITTDISGVITIKGMAQGTYQFTETEAPVGYNKLADPIEVEAKKTGEETISTTTHTIYLDAEGNITDEVTSTTVTTHTTASSLPVFEFDTVINYKGNELPETGGMGTTLFYLIGSILIIGAGVLLVTRRRVEDSE